MIHDIETTMQYVIKTSVSHQKEVTGASEQGDSGYMYSPLVEEGTLHAFVPPAWINQMESLVL